MFKFISYLIWNIFFRDSKFISSLEEWISRDFMNIVINDSLSRWHLRNFIKSDKNKVTFNDCLEHSHRMKIRECHIAKQSFARIFDRYYSTRVQDLWSVMFNHLISKNQDDSWIDVVIDSRRACILVKKMLFVLRFSMKYWEKT